MKETINAMAEMLLQLGLRKVHEMEIQRRGSIDKYERDGLREEIVELEEAMAKLIAAKKRDHAREKQEEIDAIGGTGQ